jgi:hypothetical protein
VLEFTLAIRCDGECGHAEIAENIGFESRQNAHAAPRGDRGQLGYDVLTGYLSPQGF